MSRDVNLLLEEGFSLRLEVVQSPHWSRCRVLHAWCGKAKGLPEGFPFEDQWHSNTGQSSVQNLDE